MSRHVSRVYAHGEGSPPVAPMLEIFPLSGTRHMRCPTLFPVTETSGRRSVSYQMVVGHVGPTACCSAWAQHVWISLTPVIVDTRSEYRVDSKPLWVLPWKKPTPRLRRHVSGGGEGGGGAGGGEGGGCGGGEGGGGLGGGVCGGGEGGGRSGGGGGECGGGGATT